MRGYDVDDIALDFMKGFYDWFEKDYVEPEIWEDQFIGENFHLVSHNTDFWMSLRALPNIIRGGDLYITARPISSEITRRSLVLNGHPDHPVITTDKSDPFKIKACLENGITSFLDDKPITVQKLREAGIEAYLLTRKWNQNFDLPRVNSTMEFYERTKR